jgi:hypothetical protein
MVSLKAQSQDIVYPERLRLVMRSRLTKVDVQTKFQNPDAPNTMQPLYRRLLLKYLPVASLHLQLI